MNPSPARRRISRFPRALWISLGVIVLAAAAVFACQTRPKPLKDPYRFSAVERGDITRSVSASGTLQALVTVDVGSQISGLVTKVLVDFNAPVRAGQVLATLDPQTFQSRVAQSRADIQAGEASVRPAQATLAHAQADFGRTNSMVEQGFASPAALDQATAALRVAEANVAVARGRVSQSQAALRIQGTDLQRTTITSPMGAFLYASGINAGSSLNCTSIPSLCNWLVSSVGVRS